MEPLESGQIQPLGLSHAIGPPGWRPYFQRGIPPLPPAQVLWFPFMPGPDTPGLSSARLGVAGSGAAPGPSWPKAEVGIEGASPKP